MKHKYFVTTALALFFLSQLTSGQQIVPILKSEDLIKISKMNSNDIEIYASKKNLEIEKASEPDGDMIEQVKFRHTDISEYKFQYTKYKKGCAIYTLSFDNYKLFNKEKIKVAALGFKLAKSETIDHPQKSGTKVKSLTYSKRNLKFYFYNILDKDTYEGLPYEISLTNNCN